MVKDRFTRQLLISGGIILASVAIAAGAFFFLSGRLAAQAAVIENVRTMTQNKTDLVAELVQLEAAVPQAAQYQAAIDQLLPNQYDLLTFPQWLSQLGQKYNVTVNAAFQGSMTPSTGIVPGTAPFSFSAEGAPSDLASFLDGMNAKSSGFLVSLTSFNVAITGGTEKLTGQGVVFFQ